MNSKETLEAAYENVPELVSRKQLSELTGMSALTFANWTSKGRFAKELTVIKLGRCARYRKSDVIKFIMSRTKHN